MSIERAIRDARQIVARGGFSVSITLLPLGALDPTITKGVASRHNIEFDENGYPINATNSHITLSENELTNLGLTTRNAKGNVNLDGWLATWTDGTGTARTFKIVQTKPSETLGLIICTLGRYGTN